MALATKAVHAQSASDDLATVGDLLPAALRAFADESEDPGTATRLRLLVDRYDPESDEVATAA